MNHCTIQTPQGTITLIPTEQDHIYVEADLVIRGITWKISAHYHLWANGSWNLGQEDENDYKRKQSIYGKRADVFSLDGMTDSASNKAIKIISPQVQKWAEENPTSIAIAEAEYKQQGLKHRQEQIQEHQKAIDQLQKEVEQIANGCHLLCYSAVKLYNFGLSR